MANTYVDYTGDGSNTDFVFSFPFLEDSHVVVEVDGVDKTIAGGDFTLPTTSLVRMTTAPNNLSAVRVKRVSDFGTNLVDFVNGSVLNEADLDKAYLHNRYLNEEAAEGNDASMQIVGGGTDFNAANKKIVNLATPTVGTDAANKNYIDDRVALGSTNLNAFDKSTHTGDNTETEFTLSFTSQSDTAEAYLVTIDGVVQIPTTAYSVSTSTNKITFTSAPPTSANIVVVPIGTTSSANDATVLSTGSTTSRSLSDRFGDVVNVLDYGADNTGGVDARGAIQNAITHAQSSGGIVYIPEGEYLINSVSSPDTKANGLLIPYTTANDPDNRVIIKGAGRGTILKAGSNDMYVIRLSDSFCKIQDLTIDGNSKTSVVGIGLVPEDRTQTLTVVNQNYNIITGLYIKSCEFGSIYSTGPDVSADSGCWYNVFENSILNFCTTGILLDASTNASGSNSGVNRNKFLNLRFGQSMNTGVQIDDGDTNTFTNCDFEGVNTGTAPNATPTAVKIAQTGSSSSADCNHNTFISCKMEANTRDIDNDNGSSEFYGCVVTGSKLNLNVNPLIMLGGNDASQAPQIFPGYIYQANSQIAGVPNNKAYFPNGLATDDARISTYHHFRSVVVGTIAGSGTANATIIPAQNNKRYAVEVFVVGDDTGASSTFQLRGYVIANWASTVGQRIGIGDTVFKQSLGVNDYRAYSGVSLSVSYSSNNAVLTITNNGASNLTDVNVLVRHLWS